MNKCEKCLHYCRLIVSENGWHYVCSLSQRKALNCMMNKKSHFVAKEKDEKAT